MRDVAGGHWPAVTEDLGEGQGRSDVGQPADGAGLHREDHPYRVHVDGRQRAQPVILVAREWLQ